MPKNHVAREVRPGNDVADPGEQQLRELAELKRLADAPPGVEELRAMTPEGSGVSLAETRRRWAAVRRSPSLKLHAAIERRDAAHRRAQADLWQRFRPAPQPVQPPVARRAARDPRSPRSAPTRRAARVDSDDGPPAPPLLVLVDQRTAGRWLPYEGRAFVALVKSRGVEHTRVGRRYVARLADVLRAIGLEPRPAELTARPTWSPDRLVAKLQRPAARARKGGAS